MSTTLVEVFLKKADAEASRLYARSEHLNALAKLLRAEGIDVSVGDLDCLSAAYANAARDLRIVVQRLTSTPLTQEPT